MLGAIIGDISGSRFEWTNIKTKMFVNPPAQKVIHKKLIIFIGTRKSKI